MDILAFFIFTIVLVLIVQFIMSVIYKDVEKKDTGFVFVYHQLTYRRKFLRGLWNIPLLALLYGAIYAFGVVNTSEYELSGLLLLLVVLLDIGFNYMKWKKSESLA